MPNRWIEYVKKFARENNMTYGCALSDPVMKAGYKKIPKRTQKAEREQMGAEDSDAPAPPPDPEIAKRAKKVERARVAREGIKRKMDERVAMGKEDVNVAKKKKKRVAKKKIRLVLVEDDDDGEKLSGKGTGASTMTPTLEDRWNGFLLTPEGEMVKRIYDDKRISHSQLRWATEEALEGNENINISQEQYENEVENQFSNKYHRSIEQYFTDHLEEAVPIFEPELEVMEGNGMRGGCGKCSHLFFNDVLF